MDDTLTTTYDALIADNGKEETEKTEETTVKQYRLVVTQEGLEKVKWGTYRKATQNDFNALSELMAQFLVSPEGKRVSSSEAMGILDDMTMAEVANLTQAFDELARDAAAPKV